MFGSRKQSNEPRKDYEGLLAHLKTMLAYKQIYVDTVLIPALKDKTLPSLIKRAYQADPIDHNAREQWGKMPKNNSTMELLDQYYRLEALLEQINKPIQTMTLSNENDEILPQMIQTQIIVLEKIAPIIHYFGTADNESAAKLSVLLRRMLAQTPLIDNAPLYNEIDLTLKRLSEESSSFRDQMKWLKILSEKNKEPSNEAIDEMIKEAKRIVSVPDNREALKTLELASELRAKLSQYVAMNTLGVRRRSMTQSLGSLMGRESAKLENVEAAIKQIDAFISNVREGKQRKLDELNELIVLLSKKMPNASELPEALRKLYNEMTQSGSSSAALSVQATISAPPTPTYWGSEDHNSNWMIPVSDLQDNNLEATITRLVIAYSDLLDSKQVKVWVDVIMHGIPDNFFERIAAAAANRRTVNVETVLELIYPQKSEQRETYRLLKSFDDGSGIALENKMEGMLDHLSARALYEQFVKLFESVLVEFDDEPELLAFLEKSLSKMVPFSQHEYVNRTEPGIEHESTSVAIDTLLGWCYALKIQGSDLDNLEARLDPNYPVKDPLPSLSDLQHMKDELSVVQRNAQENKKRLKMKSVISSEKTSEHTDQSNKEKSEWLLAKRGVMVSLAGNIIDLHGIKRIIDERSLSDIFGGPVHYFNAVARSIGQLTINHIEEYYKLQKKERIEIGEQDPGLVPAFAPREVEGLVSELEKCYQQTLAVTNQLKIDLSQLKLRVGGEQTEAYKLESKKLETQAFNAKCDIYATYYTEAFNAHPASSIIVMAGKFTKSAKATTSAGNKVGGLRNEIADNLSKKLVEKDVNCSVYDGYVGYETFTDQFHNKYSELAQVKDQDDEMYMAISGPLENTDPYYMCSVDYFYSRRMLSLLYQLRQNMLDVGIAEGDERYAKTFDLISSFRDMTDSIEQQQNKLSNFIGLFQNQSHSFDLKPLEAEVKRFESQPDALKAFFVLNVLRRRLMDYQIDKTISHDAKEATSSSSNTSSKHLMAHSWSKAKSIVKTTLQLDYAAKHDKVNQALRDLDALGARIAEGKADDPLGQINDFAEHYSREINSPTLSTPNMGLRGDLRRAEEKYDADKKGQSLLH